MINHDGNYDDDNAAGEEQRGDDEKKYWVICLMTCREGVGHVLVSLLF